MLTGAAELDFRDLDDTAARRRCAVLRQIPDNGRLIVHVGALAPSYEAASLLAEHVDRLRIEVQAEPWNVSRWLQALRGDWPWAATG